MEGSDFINFKFLQSEVIAKHTILQAMDSIQDNNDPLISYSGFRLFFNGVHIMPKYLFGENYKFLGSIDKLEFDIEQQKTSGKLSYYLSFEKNIYAIWIDLRLDENMIGESSTSSDLLAFTKKSDIPQERFFNKELNDIFVLDVLALHFKSIFKSYTSEAINDLTLEGEILKKGVVEYLGRNFKY